MTPQDWESWASAIESAVTTVAIIVAGCWTYFTFIKGRQRFPRAKIAHVTYHYPLPDGRTVLRVESTISNCGAVLLCMEAARVTIQQFCPPSRDILSLPCHPTTSMADELPWQTLGEKKWRLSKASAQIEPGESEILFCDFLVQPGVDKILVYTFVKNSAKSSDIGWRATTVISIRDTHGKDTSAATTTAIEASGKEGCTGPADAGSHDSATAEVAPPD